MMSLDHFERFFLLSAIGLGLVLAGTVNLALGRRGERVWLRAVATLALCALPVIGLAAAGRSEQAVRAGVVLAGVLVSASLLGSAWFSRQLAALLAFGRRPAARWGLVGLGGLGVVLASGLMFEVNDELATEQGTKELELVLGKPNTQPSSRGRAATDRGTTVTLKEAVAVREPSEVISAEEKLLRDGNIRDQVMRRSGPSDYANCHGWVFTGGKFFLGPDDVELILKENGYQPVPEPQSGDVAIYRQNGAVSHTAVVRYVAEGQPVMVEGKWGTLGVYMHPADKSFYGTDYTFYRSPRSGHLLAGLGSSPASEPMAAAHTE